MPLTLTLSPKGRGDRSSAEVNMAQVFPLFQKWRGNRSSAVLNRALVFSLSLWERVGVRASARTITHLRIDNFTPLLTGTIYR